MINHTQNITHSVRILFISLLLLMPLCYADTASQLTIEIASTPHQQEWGLMGRQSLPENQGMLFIYPHAQKLNFWMFNTYIDLSIAFIDDKNIIREIHWMKAYPEKMDPNRPVKQLADINKYAHWGPEKSFFRQHSIASSAHYPYALEVNAGWFDRHDVKVGDRMILDEKQHQLSFSRPLSGRH